MDLPADFACRELFVVDIPVCGIGCQCGYDRSEVTSSYVLSRGPYHACRSDCSGNGHLSCGVVRAGRGSRGTVAQIRAKENHDAAGHVLFAEMNVRLQDIGKPRIGQCVSERLSRLVKSQFERCMPC